MSIHPHFTQLVPIDERLYNSPPLPKRFDAPLKNLKLSNTFASLNQDFYSRVAPTALIHRASLVHFNPAVATLLDLPSDVITDPQFIDTFMGNTPLPGGDPIAMLYAGHQFGHFVSQLGDGRAIMLGEITNARNERWEVQLKGAGPTPYSRGSDGRAVLRSTIREYLCSEAMHGLGIPTTRALCITGSDDEVYREQIETAAVLTRVAPSHVRFGSFEVFFYRDQAQHIRTLADYVIKHHYPELADNSKPHVALLSAVVERTAKLMAQWQAVGFAHGVMNTDNMSILGLTLDYGPFGFMEAYEPGLICNHSDPHGRYAFDQQPQIGLWNLTCLAQALSPLMDIDDAKACLQPYQTIYTQHYHSLMVSKLGFDTTSDTALELTGTLLEMMQQSRVDYTNLFRKLGDIQRDNDQQDFSLRDAFVDRQRFDDWLKGYRAALRTEATPDIERRERMMGINPKYVLRNYMAQTAIEKAQRDKDYSEIDRLMTVLQAPFDEHPEHAHYADAPPDWATGLSVSCSS